MSFIGWKDFIIWQCSLRQRNFRMFGGKPSEGTVAIALDKKNNELTSFRSVFVEKECLNTAKMFEFIYKQTYDPETRFDKAIKFFSSEYYNTPQNFDGSFTATFNSKSKIAKNLLKLKKIDVQFFERETGFKFAVKITKLKKTNVKWKYTFYHNSFFNINLTEDIEILSFSPDKKGLKKIM
jgi:hypothetical protein